MFDLSILLSIELGLFAIGITVFTVLYSFILNKKNDLLIYTELKRRQKVPNNTILDQKIAFSNKYISSAKKINSHVLILMFYTFILSCMLMLFIGLESFSLPKLTRYTTTISLILVILSLIYLLIVLIKVTIRYHKEVKV